MRAHKIELAEVIPMPFLTGPPACPGCDDDHDAHRVPGPEPMWLSNRDYYRDRLQRAVGEVRRRMAAGEPANPTQCGEMLGLLLEVSEAFLESGA